MGLFKVRSVADGSAATDVATKGQLDAATSRQAVSGRLTLTSGTAVDNNDVINGPTLYFTPYKGNRVGLYNGTDWVSRIFNQVSFPLSSFAGGVLYDVFGYDNAGTLALELQAWTSNTRQVGLSFQDGVYVKSGIPTRRYIGTIFTSGNGLCEDSAAKRYVWNMYNRVARLMRVFEMTNGWTYTADAWRQTRNLTTNQLDFIVGTSEDIITAQATSNAAGTTAARATVGIGLDGTGLAPNCTTGQAIVDASGGRSFTAHFKGAVAPGRHILPWLERGGNVGTITWGGTSGVDYAQSGISGEVWA